MHAALLLSLLDLQPFVSRSLLKRQMPLSLLLRVLSCHRLHECVHRGHSIECLLRRTRIYLLLLTAGLQFLCIMPQSASGVPLYSPVNLASITNEPLDWLTSAKPTGNVTYQGIPFQFAASSPQVFTTQNSFAPTFATSASLAVNISYPTGLHLLVAGSATGSVAYQGLEIGRVRLTFADASEYVVVLKPGTHLRPETWSYDTGNQSTPPGDSSITVTNVITEVQNRGGAAKAFLDKFTINLPVAAANTSLTGIHFIDTSISTVGSLAPGFIIAAATVTSEPPPPPHTVTAISPSSGSTLGGTSVTITGTNLTGATTVTIGGTAAVFTVVDATSITATTPAGAAGAASVLVTVPGGTNPPNTLYTYVTPNNAPIFSLPRLSAGETWTARPSGSLSWYSIASSADGTKLAAVALGERIYTSTDSGQSWTVRPSLSDSNWGTIASSADGTKLAAAGSGSVSISSNSGQNWSYQWIMEA